ncbi:hypothetical protein ACHQM5_009846 [Ranunculus cassubicifolius]
MPCDRHLLHCLSLSLSLSLYVTLELCRRAISSSLGGVLYHFVRLIASQYLDGRLVRDINFKARILMHILREIFITLTKAIWVI